MDGILTKNKTKCRLFSIMERVRGGELFDRIVNSKRFIGGFPELYAKHLFKEIITGLKCLHNEYYGHFDLKLENIMMVYRIDEINSGDMDDDQWDIIRNTSIKIIDFGFSKKIKDLSFNYRKGTNTYYPREMLIERHNPKGQSGYKYTKYNYKADIWTAGIILFIILSGYLPYETNNDIKYNNIDESFLNRNNQNYRHYNNSYCKKWRSISDNAINLINRMLDRDPDNSNCYFVRDKYSRFTDDIIALSDRCVNHRIDCDEILKHPWLSDIS